MDQLDNYGRLAECTFVIPTDAASFFRWLRARARKQAGIGILPSRKHYDHAHLDLQPQENVAGGQSLGIRRFIMDQGNWQVVPCVCVSILPLSDRQDNTQCEIWVSRLNQHGTMINGKPAELSLWSLANSEYDSLIADILARWSDSCISSEDHRMAEWDAWNGQLPGEPPQTPTLPEKRSSKPAQNVTYIDTGGGPYIDGNVNTRGGGFAGRDQITVTVGDNTSRVEGATGLP